jgi:hypothetical protein
LFLMLGGICSNLFSRPHGILKEEEPTRPPADRPTAAEPVQENDAICYLGEAEDYSLCHPLVEFGPNWDPKYQYPNGEYSPPTHFLDLDQIDLNQPVSPSFYLSELVDPSRSRYAFIQRHTVEHLQSMRDWLDAPIRVHSGYRTPTHNDEVGGVSNSRHMYGDAIDISSPRASLTELAEACEEEHASFVLVYPGHVHCDWRESPQDPLLFQAGE